MRSTSAGTGNVDGTLVTPPRPDVIRAADSTATSARPSSICATPSTLGPSASTAWLGLRHTQLQPQQRPRPTATPHQLHAVVHDAVRRAEPQLQPGQLVYASWGEGVEEVRERRAETVGPRYTNAGQALAGGREPAGRGRHQGRRRATPNGARRRSTSAARFRRHRRRGRTVRRRASARAASSAAQHRGVEGSLAWRSRRLELRGGAQWLHARHGRPEPTRRMTARSRPTCPPSRCACRRD